MNYPNLDLIIKNSLIIDGTGQQGYPADIGITGDKIVLIQKDINCPARTVLDASGLVAAPGFIDIHSHSDCCSFLPGQKMTSKLYQGVTLEIIGNCGISCLPINEQCRQIVTKFFTANLELPSNGLLLEDNTVLDYANHVKRCSAATNIGVLLGHGSLRICIMGFAMRPPSSWELQAMSDLLDHELSSGALGLSLGLIYPPSSYGSREELIALAKVLKKHEAILSVHLRNESNCIFEAVNEMLEIARASQVHLQISHLKLIGPAQWGKARQLLDLIKSAQDEGLNITCDQYPYTATSTNMAALVPGWAQNGGLDAMCRLLAHPEGKLLNAIQTETERRGGASCVLVVSTRGLYPQFEGVTLDKIAQKLQLPPSQVVCRLLRETNGGVPCCYFSLSEEDMLTIMKEPYICIGSDGYAFPFEKGFLHTNPHPRSFGTSHGFCKSYESVS